MRHALLLLLTESLITQGSLYDTFISLTLSECTEVDNITSPKNSYTDVYSHINHFYVVDRLNSNISI